MTHFPQRPAGRESPVGLVRGSAGSGPESAQFSLPAWCALYCFCSRMPGNIYPNRNTVIIINLDHEPGEKANRTAPVHHRMPDSNMGRNSNNPPLTKKPMPMITKVIGETRCQEYNPTNGKSTPLSKAPVPTAIQTYPKILFVTILPYHGVRFVYRYKPIQKQLMLFRSVVRSV